MKKIAIAAALCAAMGATAVQAGGYAEPQMQPVTIVEDTTSDGGILVPILALIFFVATMR